MDFVGTIVIDIPLVDGGAVLAIATGGLEVLEDGPLKAGASEPRSPITSSVEAPVAPGGGTSSGGTGGVGGRLVRDAHRCRWMAGGDAMAGEAPGAFVVDMA